MKAHIIENSTVTNTIEVESLDFMPNLVEATEGGIGWSYVDGTFTAPVVDEVIVAAEARTTRDSLLAATDWTALSDITMTAEMTTYRQALRDVPAQEDFPNEIDWPTSP